MGGGVPPTYIDGVKSYAVIKLVDIMGRVDGIVNQLIIGGYQHPIKYVGDASYIKTLEFWILTNGLNTPPSSLY